VVPLREKGERWRGFFTRKQITVQDATDLFVLGVDLQNLNRYTEAEDALGGCGQIAGPLQDRCKQSAVTAKAQAMQSKSN
jgi:hypothetical protein